MRKVKRYLKGAWNWYLNYYANTYENVYSKYSYKV